MIRNSLVLIFGIALGIGAMSASGRHEAASGRHKDGESVKLIAAQDIKEKIDGKDAKVTVVEVTLKPGEEGAAHRHPGPGFVYVLEGEYELGVDDQPTRRFKAGEVFYEPTLCLHRVSKNPDLKTKTRLIAFVVHPRDAKEIVLPAHAKP